MLVGHFDCISGAALFEAHGPVVIVRDFGAVEGAVSEICVGLLGLPAHTGLLRGDVSGGEGSGRVGPSVASGGSQDVRDGYAEGLVDTVFHLIPGYELAAGPYIKS
jgi:hypothetical protein